MKSARPTFLAAVAGLALVLCSARVHAGYTHYWKWLKPQPPDPPSLEAALVEMDKLADANVHVDPRVFMREPS